MRHVVPQAKERLGEEMALVLALPLLWFEDEKLKLSPAPVEVPTQVPKTVDLLHPALQHRIIRSYKSALGKLPDSISNLVMKIPIVPQEYGDQLYISNLLTEDDGPAEIGEVTSDLQQKWWQLQSESLLHKLEAITWSW